MKGATILDRMSQKTKDEIIKLYKDGDIRTKEICAAYGIGDGTLNKIIVEADVPYRNPYQAKPRKNKICRTCGSKINPPGAKYCCECGKPLYSDKELVIKQLEKLTNYFIVLEHANRDKYIAEVNDIISNVEKLKTVDN